MQIRDETVNRFKELYKEEFGKEITVAEAQDMVHRLVSLYLKLLAPLPNKQAAGEEEKKECAG